MTHLFVRALNDSNVSWPGCAAAQLPSAGPSGGEVGTDGQTDCHAVTQPALFAGENWARAVAAAHPGVAAEDARMGGCRAEQPSAFPTPLGRLLPSSASLGGVQASAERWPQAAEPPFLPAHGCRVSTSFSCRNVGGTSRRLRDELWAEE